MSLVSQRPSAPVSRRVSPTRSRIFPLLGALGLVSAAVFAVSGCPIYSADSCSQDPNCVAPQPTPEVDTGVGPSGCDPGCPSGYVCSSISTGRYQCLPYDCRSSERACTSGTCADVGGGVYSCVSGDAGVDARSDAADTADTADTAPPVIDCTTTGCITGYKCADDGAGGKACTSTDPNACAADAECTAKTGAGSLCLGGVCKAAKDLCTDSTQCLDGKSCVDGRCIAKCTATSGCASGYTCDTKSGLCVGGASVCGGASGGDAGADSGVTCATGSKCVATHCVDKCATDGSCRPGLVCVAGGCVPNDQPNFFCDKAGTTDGTQDLCAAGSICLHHNCYLACTGPSDTTTCAKADKFPVCKTVTTSSGDHDVCGSSTNLGTDCDLTTTPPKTCATGKVCIDGFCK